MQEMLEPKAKAEPLSQSKAIQTSLEALPKRRSDDQIKTFRALPLSQDREIQTSAKFKTYRSHTSSTPKAKQPEADMESDEISPQKRIDIQLRLLEKEQEMNEIKRHQEVLI